MPVEIREVLIKTDIHSSKGDAKPLADEQLAQLKEELLAQMDKRINRQIKRDSFNR